MKLAVVGAILGVIWVFWSMRPRDHELDRVRRVHTATAYAEYVRDHPDDRSDVRDDFARLHDAARAHIDAAHGKGAGLDVLLAPLRTRVDHVLGFEASHVSVDRESFAGVEAALASPQSQVATLADHLARAGGCDDGISDAFHAATESDVIEFHDDTLVEPALHVTYAVRASGTGYVEGNSRRIYPGIVLEGSLELVEGGRTLVTMPFKVIPAPDVAFTTYGIQFVEGSHDSDVADALVKAACKQVGFRLLEQLTGYVMPVETHRAQHDADACERGNSTACIAAATELGGRDPKQAQALLDKGCRAQSPDAGRACIEAAELALANPPSSKIDSLADPMLEARVHAELSLRTGCEANDPAACTRLAEVELMPHTGEAAPGQYSIDQAIRDFVRACDLGAATACERAAAWLAKPGLGGTPLPSAAAVLATRACAGKQPCPDAARWAKARDTQVLGVATAGDRVFDVRWGDWTNMDEGGVVFWLASSAPRDAVLARPGVGRPVRVYGVDEQLPYELEPPPGTKTIWGVLASESRWPDDRECPMCKTNQASDPLYARGCTCLPITKVQR